MEKEFFRSGVHITVQNIALALHRHSKFSELFGWKTAVCFTAILFIYKLAPSGSYNKTSEKILFRF